MDLGCLEAKRARLAARARVLDTVRSFFRSSGFLEVDTPLLSRFVLPEEHIDPVEAPPGFLLPSPEIHMKALLAAGYERIFQLGKCFRKGERGRRHLPEFCMLEWYRSRADYRALAADCEALVLRVFEQGAGTPGLLYQGVQVDLTPPWPRLAVRDAFRALAGWDPVRQEDPDRLEIDLAEKVLPRLDPSRPVFLVDFPLCAASLARPKGADPRVAERVELFVAGMELANGFSELTDAREQRSRFERANRVRAARGGRVHPMPEAFLAVVDRLPPSAGMALGVDRLVMLRTDAGTIDDVVAVAPGVP